MNIKEFTFNFRDYVVEKKVDAERTCVRVLDKRTNQPVNPYVYCVDHETNNDYPEEKLVEHMCEQAQLDIENNVYGQYRDAVRSQYPDKD